MAFNKIQPEQIQLATFFSDSGDLNITQTDTGVQMNLSKGLTGDFSFTGSLSINGKSVFGLANTGNNEFDIDSGNILFLGANTQIGDSVIDHDNVGILANLSQISGINNVALNVSNTSFSTGSQNNTALAGNSLSFAKEATGSVILKDTTSSSQTAISPQSLYVNFGSGHFFEGGRTYFETHASFGESGIFSGSLEVLGSGFLTGQEIITKHYLTGYAENNFVNRSDHQIITGEKRIVSSMRFDTGFQLPAYTGTVQGAHYVGIGSSSITTGSLAISGHTLYICVGGTSDNVPKWAGIPISGTL
tara:strand:+ start:204 stop:1115 length:912 start_codon:yes stop_codon:yes gene_type:complete